MMINTLHILSFIVICNIAIPHVIWPRLQITPDLILKFVYGPISFGVHFDLILLAHCVLISFPTHVLYVGT